MCGSSESAPLSSAAVQECRPSSWSGELWTATIPAELKEPLRNFPGTQWSTVGSSSVPSPPLGRLRCSCTSPRSGARLCPSANRGPSLFPTHSSCLAAELRKSTIVASCSCQKNVKHVGVCGSQAGVLLRVFSWHPRHLSSPTHFRLLFQRFIVWRSLTTNKNQMWMLFQVHFSPSDESVRLYKVLLLQLVCEFISVSWKRYWRLYIS